MIAAAKAAQNQEPTTLATSSTTVLKVQVTNQEEAPAEGTVKVASEPASVPAETATAQEPASASARAAGAEDAAAANQQLAQLASAAEGDDINPANADNANRRIGELGVEIEILSKVLTEQRQQRDTATSADARVTVEDTIASVESRIRKLEREFDARNRKFEAYLTSVQPNDKDLYITARKSSQVYPKIPYYIPGTREQGEFWVEPKVSDVGELVFNFRLIDPTAENDTTRNLIQVTLPQLKDMQASLLKLSRNSKLAHENKIRRNYQKRVTCFPSAQCPAERQNGEPGKSSTEVIFLIYEDGSTGGRIQINKGAFQEGVNFSIDSAMLLQAYLTHVIREAELEFKSGSQSVKDLDQIFE